MSAVEAPVRATAATAPHRRVSTRFFRSELGMIYRRRRNQVILAILAAAPILIAIAVKISAPRNGDGPPFLSQITQNGVFVAFTALTVVIPFFLPLAIAVVSGDAVSGEAGSGTLRYLLVVPVSRTRLLAVKYGAVIVYCLTAALVVAAVGVIIGLILFPSGAATLLSGTAVSFGAAVWRLFLAALYVAGCMAALGAIGLFISTLVESPVAAMASTAGVAITVQILDNVPQLHAIQPYLFSHWWLSFGDLLRTPIAGGDVVHGLVVAVAYAGLFLALAWSRFTSKDVSS